MAADPRKIALVAILCLAVAACAELGPEAYDPSTAPMPVLTDASSSSHDMFANPDVLPADKVIKNGETHGRFGGQDYTCGNPDCSVAVKTRGSPPPEAQDKPHY